MFLFRLYDVQLLFGFSVLRQLTQKVEAGLCPSTYVFVTHVRPATSYIGDRWPISG